MLRSILLSAVLALAAGLQRTQPRMSLAVGSSFPSGALSKIGVKGKPAVLYFYGADESPSCTKQAEGFSADAGAFADVQVVGIRSDAGVKDGFAEKYAQRFYVDRDDEIRDEIGIAKDFFGFLGGRETYVLDKDGTVCMVFNGQLNPEKHVEAAKAAVADLPTGGGGGGFDFASLLPKF